jgi:predicted metallopeptidase
VIEYFDAPDIRERVLQIIYLLKFDHVKLDRVHFIRSRGSKSERTIARIHGLGRIWQEALMMEPTYILEIVHELFDFAPREIQDKTLIHEVLHIPHGFKGGFRHHKNYVTKERVDTWYKRYLQIIKDRGLERV